MGYQCRERQLDQGLRIETHVYGDLFVTEWVCHISGGKDGLLNRLGQMVIHLEKDYIGSLPQTVHSNPLQVDSSLKWENADLENS